MRQPKATKMITCKGLHIERPVGLGMGNTMSQGLDVSSQPAAAKTRPSGTLAHEHTDAQAGRRSQRHVTEKMQLHLLELEESRTRREKAADARKRKQRMERGFVDHPHKSHARLPRTTSEPEKALEEPAGGMDSDAKDHVDAKEAWYREIKQRELENDSQANESKDETSLTPAQTSSRNTNETSRPPSSQHLRSLVLGCAMHRTWDHSSP
ncbi:hypothetical protein JB92DRAFT_3100402 [Gautieria morchelliformis]|nr:hypothetical protein JB92DRAFT_3100402 [Gautieria morchelliformis]